MTEQSRSKPSLPILTQCTAIYFIAQAKKDFKFVRRARVFYLNTSYARRNKQKPENDKEKE